MAPKNPGITMGNWLGGCNSLLPPDHITQGQYSWGINVVNRGGIVQTRPGQDCIASIQGERAQGFVIFTPKGSKPMMLVAVDGIIYVAKFPFFSFSPVDGLKFVATAPIINFQPVLKSVKLRPDGSLELIDPLAMVIIQDGTTKPGVFDGTTGVHSTTGAPFYGVPIGLWMAWTSSRLWVFNKSRGYVSDLANPDTFNENSYLAERSNFELPSEVTGCIQTSDEKALLVFTSGTTTTFQSNILDRKLWGQTADFQKVLLPTIGCVSGRSPVNQYGLTWWMSRAGFINLNAAVYSLRNSLLSSVDGEMMRSKRILSPDMETVATAFYDNYLLCSVPVGGKYNEQTWVIDQSPVGQADQGAPMCWVGIWTGARPVVWSKTEFSGRERIYFLGYDHTAKDGTNIHVWEAFKEDRRDNNGRIACQMETAMPISAELSKFRYAEIELCEILGTVELSVFFGATKGPWIRVLTTTIQAQVGSIGSPAQRIITKGSILRSFKPQSRQIKTQEFISQGKGCGGVETMYLPGKDTGFQLLLEWRGRMGVKQVRIFADPDPSADSGKCATSETGKVNILTDQGETIKYP